MLGGENELGKDRVTLFIKNVNISVLHTDKHLWRIHYNESINERYKHRRGYYTYGTMVSTVGVFNVNYLRYSSTQGDILLSFCVAKLYNGNNGISKSNISTIDLIKRIGSGLSNVMCMDKLPAMYMTQACL